MSATALMTRRATVTRRTEAPTRDAHGTVDWVETTDTVYVEVQQTGTVEENTTGQLVSTQWRLFAPPDSDLHAGDALTVDGIRFEIDGEPWPVRNPRSGALSHLEAQLTRGA